ncbi:MAG: RraA family protein [Chloroflexi bacterium]|nr:RraA family protein [Chloroflexota bacterium]
MSIEEMIRQFREMPTGFVTDAFTRLGLAGWSEGVTPLSRTTRKIAGRAVTVQYQPKRGSGAKKPSHYEVMLNMAQPGDVLVIAAANTPCWLLGENQAHYAMYRGLSGIVVDGCVRDADEIAEMAMPVFARGTGTRPFSTHLELADVNVPVEFAGTQIHPGDIVLGDGDGLVVVPSNRAEEVLFQALDIAVIEQDMEESIAHRVSLAEIETLLTKKKNRKER